MSASAPPPRVRVTSSRRHAARSRPVPLSHDVAEHTDLGQVYVAGLLGAQFRLSMLVLGTITAGLLAIPLLHLVLPSVGRAQVVGIPVPWLVLGVAAYPVLWWASRAYARQAERIERQFSDVIGGR